ncbi:hypothetical protein [Enterobacter kobei]|uniref:hypothetical protein n=1 Tax=Enterobacter kobei TaxID=208224 RepID=UPI001E4779B0|nr:hypothetical protein [Enterobacter kobei]
MSVKHNLEQWIAQLDYDDTCDISDRQVSDLIRDYAALEARCAALAAENEGLKKFCKDAAFDADYEAELGMERGGFADALNDIKTPATDAFLAEVRTQGVEMFGQWLRDSADIFDKNSRHDWADQNRISADKAGEFAAQLRKGVQS